MSNPDLFQPNWRWRAFILCHLVALILTAPCLIQPLRAAMLELDAQLFHALNAPLADHIAWRYLWSITSLRPFDLIAGITLLALTVQGGWVFSRPQVRTALFGFITLLVLLLIIRTLYTKLTTALGLQHASPTDVLSSAVHLNDYFPTWEAKWELKDRSSASFPGDHASVLLLWGVFMTAFARPKALPVIWGVTLAFMLPRLVAGAHWASDDYTGGVAIALLAWGWGFYTPYTARVTHWLLGLTAPLFRRAERIPLLSRLSLFNPTS